MTILFCVFFSFSVATTPTDDPGCDSYQFSCDNGQCVPASYRCDGGNDCGDTVMKTDVVWFNAHS